MSIQTDTVKSANGAGKPNTALPTVEDQAAKLPAPVPATPSTALMSVIEKAISDPSFDVDKLTKLLDFQERVMEKQAEIEFNEAFARMSEKLPRITRRGSVGYKDKKTDKVEEAFRFATYEDIDAHIRPLLAEEGFSLSFDAKERDTGGGGALVTGTLSHRGGHKRTATMAVALDSSGGKNNIQAMGSSISYGKRYTMTMLLNIVTVGEDNDAESIDPEFISNEQAVEIDMLIRETNSNKEKFLAWIVAEDVQKITTRDYPKALNMLKAKKKEQADKAGGFQ